MYTGVKKLKRKALRKTKLDNFNAKLSNEAMDNKDATHVTVLHPTKGYRQILIARMIAAGNPVYMLQQIYGTIERAMERTRVKRAIEQEASNVEKRKENAST